MSRRDFLKNQSTMKKAERNGFKHKKRFPFWLLIFIIVIIFIGLIIGQGKYLVIRAIEIEIEHSNSNLIFRTEIEEIFNNLQKEKWLSIFPKNTFLTLTNRRIKNQFLVDSRIDSIKISRYWLKGKIKMHIFEKNPLAQLSILGDKDYYLDSVGQIIQSIPLHILRPLSQESKDNIYNLSTNDLPIIFDKTNLIWDSTELKNGLKNALKAIKTFNKEQDGISLVSLEISENNGILEAKATTDQGWRIFLLLNDQLERQMANLRLVLSNKIKNAKIEYIDLRFGNKIFYK